MKDIRRATRRQYSAEEKIRIVLDGLKGEDSIAELCRREGISTDAFGRSSDERIWSAGDCASFSWNGAFIRLESVQNAIDQAENVAANILGADKPYDPLPWFWSDQFDCKLQIAGLNFGYDDVVERGEIGGAASFWYFKGERLLAVDAMNDPRAFMVAKRLLAGAVEVDKGTVEDPTFDVKNLLV